jgi:hypothetical protein
MSNAANTLYAALGVAPNADVATIEAAFDRKLQRAQAAASAPPPSVLTHDEAAQPTGWSSSTACRGR